MKVIQKGENDPINLVRQNEFIRLLDLDGNNILIGVSKIEDKLKIRVLNNTICSETSAKLSILITRLFGLDDPLLHNRLDFEFSYNRPLNFLMTVHGYLSVFEAAVQTIIGQLISANVANSLREKFNRKFGNSIVYNKEKYFSFPSPSTLGKLSPEQIQEVGISKLKSQAIINFAKEFIKENLEESLTNIENPEEIRKILTNFYGIGRWTSDWISLRALRRFEVIPSGDLIIRKAFSWWFNKSSLLSSKEIDLLCQDWYPYGGALAYRIMYSYNKHADLNSLSSRQAD
jgi:DNA-3-methyladenine glycosylase II